MKYLKRIIILISFFLLPVLLYKVYIDHTAESVTFLFTSDGHGHVLPSIEHGSPKKRQIGGLATLGGFIAEFKHPYILTDSGDMFQGTPESILTKGRIVAELMTEIGYDIAAVGNHEFDLGQDVLREFTKTAGFTMLGTNIKEIKTNSVPEFLTENIIKDLKGIKIGFISSLPRDMRNLTFKKNIEGIKFINPLKAVNEGARALKAAGADIVVLLSHSGLKEDVALAGKVNKIDVILGGHTHKELKKPEIVNNKIICQPGKNFRNIGYLKLLYSINEKKILSYSYKLYPLYTDKYPALEQITESINKLYENELKGMADVIGYSEVFLPNYMRGKQLKHGELALGNWQADLMRLATESDLAFQNSGGIRSYIPQGDIKVRDIWELSPFGNTLVKMTLKGKQIKELLEYSVSNKYSNLQVSGLKVVYNTSLPKGRKVLNVIVNDDKKGKIEIVPEKEYTIVTNSFLAEGGDGYKMFLDGIEREDTKILLRDLQIEYIKNNSPVSAKIEKRLLNVDINWANIN